MRIERAVFLMIVLVSASLLLAQTYEGGIEGTITDPSGAVVAQASMTITNTATNVSRKVITNGTGEYVAPNLEPGTYTVTAEITGFKKTESKAFVLEVGRTVRVDLKLQPGAVNETTRTVSPGFIL